MFGKIKQITSSTKYTYVYEIERMLSDLHQDVFESYKEYRNIKGELDLKKHVAGLLEILPLPEYLSIEDSYMPNYASRGDFYAVEFVKYLYNITSEKLELVSLLLKTWERNYDDDILPDFVLSELFRGYFTLSDLQRRSELLILEYPDPHQDIEKEWVKREIDKIKNNLEVILSSVFDFDEFKKDAEWLVNNLEDIYPMNVLVSLQTKNIYKLCITNRDLIPKCDSSLFLKEARNSFNEISNILLKFYNDLINAHTSSFNFIGEDVQKVLENFYENQYFDINLPRQENGF